MCCKGVADHVEGEKVEARSWRDRVKGRYAP